MSARQREVQCEAHAFAKDVLECHCGGRRQIIAAILQPEVIEAVLGCLGLPTAAADPAPARAPPQDELELVDPEWDEAPC